MAAVVGRGIFSMATMFAGGRTISRVAMNTRGGIGSVMVVGRRWVKVRRTENRRTGMVMMRRRPVGERMSRVIVVVIQHGNRRGRSIL